MGRDDSEFELTFKPALANHIPTLVVPPSVLLHVVRRCLMRCMGGTEWKVCKKRPVRPNTLKVIDHLKQVVNKVLREVVPLLRAAWWGHLRVVSNEFWVELVGFSLEKAIEAIEASTEWPLIKGACSRDITRRREVPFTCTECCVPV